MRIDRTPAALPEELSNASNVKEYCYTEQLAYIYFLVKRGAVVYVGQTKNIIQRIEAHRKDLNKSFDRVFFIETAPHELDKIERDYITRLSPPYNQTTGNKKPYAPPQQRRSTQAMTQVTVGRVEFRCYKESSKYRILDAHGKFYAELRTGKKTRKEALALAEEINRYIRTRDLAVVSDPEISKRLLSLSDDIPTQRRIRRQEAIDAPKRKDKPSTEELFEAIALLEGEK